MPKKRSTDGLRLAATAASIFPPLKNITPGNRYPIEVDVKVGFAVKLHILRKKKRLTQGQVAKKLGVSQQAYAKLENPDTANPSLATIQKI